MSFRKGVYSAVILAVVAVLIFAPVSSDADALRTMDIHGVTASMTGETVNMNTAESLPISIHIYNGNDHPITVKITDTGDSVIKLSADTAEMPVAKETAVTMEASLSTDRYTSMGDYSITLKMQVMDDVTDPYETTLVVPISVTSNYSSGENYNRFFGIIDNNLPSPYNTAIAAAAITLILWFGISIAAGVLSLAVLKFIFKVTERESDNLGRNTVIGVSVCILLMGVQNCAYIIGAPENIVAELSLVFGTLYIIFAALVIWDIYKALITSALTKMEKRGVGGMDTTLIPLFKAIGKIVIILLCITLILSKFGVNFVTLIASAGLTGLGLSFGVKPAINELFSGIVVLMTRPFKVGDYVTVGTNSRYKVEEIGILRTTFSTGYSNEIATMPNSKIASSRIVNISHNTLKYRNTISFKVPFDSNLTLIKKIAKRVASDHPNIVTDGSVPKPNAVFTRCDDGSAMIVTLAFYVNDYDNNKTTSCQIREGILREFRERDIKIPLNKMEVTLFKGGQNDAQ